MAGDSLKAALLVNFTIGVLKTIVGLLTNSAAMIAEAYHSYADTFNQILLAVGIKRSEREPDLEHPFGYSKVQFFWAFVVAVLIFGISGSLAFFEGIEILRHPGDHHVNTGLVFYAQIAVLAIAIVLESFALNTAVGEAQEFQEELGTETFLEAVEEMQDPVLLSLLVEDSLALIGLVVALIGSIVTVITKNPVVDGFTSVLIGAILMVGGLLLARENKKYLVGKAVTHQIQAQIENIVKNFDGIKQIKNMRTMLLGPDDMILALDVVFTSEARNSGVEGVADDIDKIEKLLSDAVEQLTPSKIFIETQLDKISAEAKE